MSTLFSRENIIKAAVVLFVLAFLFELFAFAPRQAAPPPPPEPEEQVETVVGVALINATITSYAAELDVFGSSPEIDSAINELRKEGKILYTNRLSPNRTVLNLAGSSQAAEVAARLARTGASVLGRASAIIPGAVEFTISTGTLLASTGGRAVFPLDPRIGVGENVTIRITALIQRGAVVQTDVPRVVPQAEDVLLTADIKNFTAEAKAVLTLAWENRLVNAQEILKGLNESLPGARAAGYSLIPAIGVENASAPLDALRNLSFVVGVQENIVTVQDNFTDRALAEKEILAVAGVNASLVFPDARLNISFTLPENANITELEALLAARFNATRARILRFAALELSDKAEGRGGRLLEVLDRRASGFVDADKQLGDSVLAAAKASVVGSKIVKAEI
ncbi:MAG: hypothetical protein QXH27_00100 [Candidatus Micrarchaeia archaeon]